jgi:hypothetical protein
MAALEGHRRKLVTDPTYPLALVAIGKAVIRISIPKAAIAAACANAGVSQQREVSKWCHTNPTKDGMLSDSNACQDFSQGTFQRGYFICRRHGIFGPYGNFDTPAILRLPRGHNWQSIRGAAIGSLKVEHGVRKVISRWAISVSRNEVLPRLTVRLWARVNIH